MLCFLFTAFVPHLGSHTVAWRSPSGLVDLFQHCSDQQRQHQLNIFSLVSKVRNMLITALHLIYFEYFSCFHPSGDFQV